MVKCNILLKDIQAGWWSTMWNGELGRSLAYPLKLGFIPITRIENRCASGQDVLINAYHAACFAQLAQRYAYHWGIPIEKLKETMTKIGVKNHYNGSLNPKAQFQRAMTFEQVMNAPIISYPVGLLDAAGVTDGAAAAIVCRADMAKNYKV